jgi:hypothetical protein
VLYDRPRVTEDRRKLRQRVYSLVALVLTSLLAVVAMAALLQVGQNRIEEGVYRDPVLTLRAIGEAQNRFRLALGETGQPRRYAASLAELEEGGCITRRLASGAVGGYHYRVLERSVGWAAAATPAAVGSLHYFIDQSHVVRARRGDPATAESSVFWHPLRGLEWTEATDLAR